MVPLGEARRLVLETCGRRPGVITASVEALGRVITAPVVAAEAVPPFTNSAVDGFAVRAVDVASVPVELTVVATVAAGGWTDRALGAGETIRIMTGALLPEQADAVVMVEDSEPLDASGSRVRLTRSATRGEAVRSAGSDIDIGDEVLAAGTVLRPAHLGVLASIGVTTVIAGPRLRVGVLSTGDELVEAGQALGTGQIRESNKPMLLALVAETGAEAVDLGLVADDEDALVAVLADAAQRCDAVLSSGGVSMGDFDVVKLVLDRVGTMQWLQIAIKPAKPFAFGLLTVPGGGAGVPLFGLPGNPVSSMVSFELLARPALRQMMGYSRLDRPCVPSIADEPLTRRPDAKTHFVRVAACFGPDGRLHVRPTGVQGSHQLASSAGAAGLAVLPDGHGIDAGDEVDVLVLSLDAAD